MSLLRYESQTREPLVDGHKTYHDVTEDICKPVEAAPSRLWWVGFIISVALLLFGVVSLYKEVVYGTGMWNLNKTIGWGWDITNFVWWVGIGHAGTLISAILLLFRQGWRTGVNRAAEAMTIFAVICAGQFPIWHMGRVWMAFFVMPYPNTRGPLWVNFNSPLLWDVFAISTYFTVSLLFWYSGLLPDMATLRDRAKKKWAKAFYGVASFGWSGSTKHWQRHESLSLVLAGLSTPLVLSVHTIVSFDFATSVIPGWHTTIFPPYFVAGAIFSGFAMVQTLMIVEDEVLVSILLRDELQKAGYKVLDLTDRLGAAMEVAKAEKPDLALVNIRLARGDDGIELSKHLKGLGIPVLLISGQVSRASSAKTVAIGSMPKPYDPDEMVLAVAYLLARLNGDDTLPKPHQLEVFDDESFERDPAA